jgi:hypothetical protein
MRKPRSLLGPAATAFVLVLGVVAASRPAVAQQQTDCLVLRRIDRGGLIFNPGSAVRVEGTPEEFKLTYPPDRRNTYWNAEWKVDARAGEARWTQVTDRGDIQNPSPATLDVHYSVPPRSWCKGESRRFVVNLRLESVRNERGQTNLGAATNTPHFSFGDLPEDKGKGGDIDVFLGSLYERIGDGDHAGNGIWLLREARLPGSEAVLSMKLEGAWGGLEIKYIYAYLQPNEPRPPEPGETPPGPTPGPSPGPSGPGLACGFTLGPEILAKWQALGGENGRLGCPTANQTTAPTSPQGSEGYWVPFGKGEGAVVIQVTSGPGAGKTSSVDGCFYKLYKQLGGPAGWLGMPLGDAYEIPGGSRQDFEGGYLLWNATTYVCTAYAKGTAPPAPGGGTTTGSGPGGGTGGGGTGGGIGASTTPTAPPPPPKPQATPEPYTGGSGMILQAARRRVAAGQLVTVPIWLVRSTDVANLNAEVAYDAGVVAVEGAVQKGNLLSNSLFSANPNRGGQVLFGFAGTTGVSGTGTVAYLSFRAVGSPGSRTPLTLAVTTINRPGGAVPPISLINGEIEIVGPGSEQLAGDCDGDGRTTELDALCALQMSVQLIPVKMNLDVDASGDVTSRDSVLLLGRALGKNP